MFKVRNKTNPQNNGDSEKCSLRKLERLQLNPRTQIKTLAWCIPAIPELEGQWLELTVAPWPAISLMKAKWAPGQCVSLCEGTWMMFLWSRPKVVLWSPMLKHTRATTHTHNLRSAWATQDPVTRCKTRPEVALHISNYSPWEADVGVFLWIQGQPHLPISQNKQTTTKKQ